MKKWLTMLLILAVLIVFVVWYVIYFNQNNNVSNDINGDLSSNIQEETILTYVTIDINPSIELAVDQNDIVMDSITLNEDADIAYDDLNLVGQDVEEATETIIDTAIDLGYITEISDTNAVNVTSYSDDETRRDALNSKIIDKLNAHFETRKIYALVVENGLDDELKSKADSYGITYGKMLLVARAMELDSSLVESDLAKLSIKEIQSQVKTEAIARREEVRTEIQAGQQEFKDLKAQKIAEAKTKLEQEKVALMQGVGDPSELSTEQKQTLIEERKDQIKEEIQNVKDDLKQSGNTIKEEVKESVQNKYLLKKNK
jgi:hypothetical protein